MILNNKSERNRFDSRCFYAMIIMEIIYIVTCFRSLPGINTYISLALLVLITIACELILLIVHKLTKRWIYSIIITCLPWCIYSLLMDGKNILKNGKVAFICMVAVILISASIAVLRSIYRHKTSCIKNYIGAGLSIIICCAVIMIPMFSFANNRFSVSSNQGMEERNECNIEDSIEELSCIRKWESLSINSRLVLLTKVTEIESSHLGLAKQPEVKIEAMDKNLAGTFSKNINTISINIDLLTDNSSNRGYKLLKTICHECFHAWEYQLVDTYNSCKDEKVKSTYPYNMAPQYAENFTSYVSANDNKRKYETQKVESDAYAYEEIRYKDYEYALNEYSN